MSDRDHGEAALERFIRAKRWSDTAELIADDALYALCHSVVMGDISAREVSRRTGIPKTTVTRLVGHVRQGSWTKTSPSLRPDVDTYRLISRDVTGEDSPVPFEYVETGEGTQIHWL